MTKAKKQSEIKNVVFTSTIEFAKVHEPDTKFKKDGEYSVTLVLDTPEKIKEFKAIMAEHGIPETVMNPRTRKVQPKLQDKGDGKLRFTVKRPALSRNGEKVEILVGNALGHIVPKSVLIGNGTLADVHMFTYPIKDMNGDLVLDPDTGKPEGALRLSKLQVRKLVRYSKGGGFGAVDGEFTDSFQADENLFDVTDDSQSIF